MYSFVEQKKLSNYRYSNKDVYNKETSWLFYESYISHCERLNTATKEKVFAHKQMIDSAITMVKSQIARGLNGDSMNIKAFVFPQNFNMNYAYYVVRYVMWEAQMKEKQQNSSFNLKIKETCAQKYWVYKNMIKTYGLRDTDKTSMYQAFVEFESAVLSDGLIKLNLKMSNKAYKNRDKIFMDGFDLVTKDNEVYVRHVSERIVEKRQNNGIRQVLMIDGNCGIHSAIIQEKDERLLNDKDKEVIAIRQFYSVTPFVKKTLNKIRSYKKPEDFHKDLESLRPSIRARLKSILENTEASKVILTLETESNTIFTYLQQMFIEEVYYLCRMLGIESSTFENKRLKIEDLVVNIRRKVSRKSYAIQPSKTDYVKWYEHMFAWLYLIYNAYTPCLVDSYKFIIDDMVEDKEPQLDKLTIQYPERPNYTSKERYIWLFTSTPDPGLTIEQETIRAIAEHTKRVKHVAWKYYLDYCRLNKLTPVPNPNFADISKEYYKEYSDLYGIEVISPYDGYTSIDDSDVVEFI